jgi:hypothetical protein
LKSKEEEHERAARDCERAAAQKDESAAALEREATAAARARRERDETRAERDHLKVSVEALAPFRERYALLVSSLARGLALPLEPSADAVLSSIAKLRELVLVHEPPAFGEVRERFARVRAASPDGPVSSDAAARTASAGKAEARYGSLVSLLQRGEGGVQDALELSRILAAHEEDERWLSVLEAALERGLLLRTG